MERSRGICVSGWSNSICKDLKVGTDFSMVEECGFFFLFILFLWDFNSTYCTSVPFFTIIQNTGLSKHEKFPFPCYIVAAFDTFEYSLLLEMLFFTLLPGYFSPPPPHAPQPPSLWYSSQVLFLCWFWTCKCWSSLGLKAQPSALLNLGNSSFMSVSTIHPSAFRNFNLWPFSNSTRLHPVAFLYSFPTYAFVSCLGYRPVEVLCQGQSKCHSLHWMKLHLTPFWWSLNLI